MPDGEKSYYFKHVSKRIHYLLCIRDIQRLFAAGLTYLEDGAHDHYYASVLKSKEPETVPRGQAVKAYKALMGDMEDYVDTSDPLLCIQDHAGESGDEVLALEDELNAEPDVPAPAVPTEVEPVASDVNEPAAPSAAPSGSGSLPPAAPPVSDDREDPVGAAAVKVAHSTDGDEDVVVMVRRSQALDTSPLDFTSLANLPHAEGMKLNEEISRFGYHRIHIRCPFAHSRDSGHWKCATSRVVKAAYTQHYGNSEVWGFLGAWAQAAVNIPNKEEHIRHRPSLAEVTTYLREKGAL